MNKLDRLAALSAQMDEMLKIVRPVSLISQMDYARQAEGAVYTALMQARVKIAQYITACDDAEYKALPEDVREDMAQG